MNAACRRQAVQVRRDDLVGDLGLAVRLGMECEACAELGADEPEQFLPQRAGEQRVAVATMDSGTLWSLTMVSKNALVTVVAEYGWPRAMMWVYFKNQSTTVRMIDMPPTLGNLG
jgi:hypothetical protein